VPNFIENAEYKLNRTLNLRNEETALSVSISSGVAAVPADFKALKFAYYDETPVRLLDWVPIEQLYRDWPDRSDTGSPSVISRETTNFVFGKVASDGTLKGVYYAKQDNLATTDPSWYVTNAPEVLLYGALLEAEPFLMRDARIPIWRAMFNESVDTIKTEERNSSAGHGHLQASVG
jgi:hypothetical protein